MPTISGFTLHTKISLVFFIKKSSLTLGWIILQLLNLVINFVFVLEV